MRIYRAKYAMGDIVTGGYFESRVVARDRRDVKGILNETHGDEIRSLYIENDSEEAIGYHDAEVLNTNFR